MKLLYHHRIASKDGQFVHVEELISALRSQGVEVVIVGPRGTGTAGFGGENRVVARLKKLLPDFCYELLEFGYALVAFVKLGRAVRQHRPDGIYERYNLFQPAGIWISKVYGLPLLSEVNAPLAEERARYSGLALVKLAAWSERYVWRNAAVVLPVTEVLAAKIRAAGVPRDRIRVVPNGVNALRYRTLPDPEEVKRTLGLSGRQVLGFTGFMREWHGLERVVELVARDTSGRRCALLVGDGPVRNSLERYAAHLGVSDRVRITGVVEHEKVSEFVAAFDVALQPSVVSYASPLKLFDYMAQGKAIVAPNTANIKEVLDDGVSAKLFAPEDPREFLIAAEELLEDPGARARLGDAARKVLWSKPYTWQENARRIQQLIEALLNATATAET
ncbi:glycosyltransferase family 4 protein [Lentisalinibacter salinarum]|uniref:glycosyltransferase family 4 protein n=1 Tax=Lentisalinibacter salinarum TaxID=2992239 RepID=UPI00386981AD